MSNKSLDLLLVNPSLDWKYDQEKKINMRVNKDIPNQEAPNIGIAYILGIAKKQGINAKYIDMVMERYSPEDLISYVEKVKPSLIGFTAFTVQVNSAANIASKIKNHFSDIKICLGGPHATAIPLETLEEFKAFDFVVCGEAEDELPYILDFLHDESKLNSLNNVVTRSKKLETSMNWNPVSNLNELPFPAWEEFDLDKYPGTYPHRTKLELPLISGRGCPYKCVFCCRVLGDKIRHRTVDSVINEINHDIDSFGCESIAFNDETFTIHKKWCDEFFIKMENSGLNKKITWSCSTRVNGITPEFLKKMKDAGCYYIFYGIESGDDATLKRIKKDITVAQARDVVKWTKQAGIVPVGAFIIGLPGDTEKEVYKGIELAEELDLYSVTFPIAVPFPGTELREMALNNKNGMKILSNNWDYYGKQDPGVMDSLDFSWERRKALQVEAYERNPKKNFSDYVNRLNRK